MMLVQREEQGAVCVLAGLMMSDCGHEEGQQTELRVGA